MCLKLSQLSRFIFGWRSVCLMSVSVWSQTSVCVATCTCLPIFIQSVSRQTEADVGARGALTDVLTAVIRLQTQIHTYSTDDTHVSVKHSQPEPAPVWETTSSSKSLKLVHSTSISLSNASYMNTRLFNDLISFIHVHWVIKFFCRLYSSFPSATKATTVSTKASLE